LADSPILNSSVEGPDASEARQMPRNGHDKPDLPGTHYLDNRIFTDAEIFRQEQSDIFQKVWMFVCHESEVANPRIGISNGLVCEKPGKPDSALGGQPMPAWMAWNWRLGRCLVWIRPALTARLALVGP